MDWYTFRGVRSERRVDLLRARSRIAWRVSRTEFIPSSPSLRAGLMSLIASGEDD